ncbi:MAG: cytochrome c3 family protein [Candidatus Sulfobium sp.]|jgi:predicted CXXCH cytochrome family protein
MPTYKRAAAILALAVLVILAGESRASYNTGGEAAICLGCHSSRDMAAKFKNGETMSIYVDQGLLGASAHKNLGCSSCHSDVSLDNHPAGMKFTSRKAFSAKASGACRKCHGFRSGLHARMLAKLKTVVCTDCHGFHDVRPVEAGMDSCHGCHRYKLVMPFKDGSVESVHVEEGILKNSVHNKLRCVDCHFGFSSKEHPVRAFESKRDFTIVSTEICRRCHFDKYTKTLESIHFNILVKGNLGAPVCVDCHGAHSVESGRKEKNRSARKCKQCHALIYAAYTHSVHGNALISDNNQDVPVCSDCHRAHDISDPRLTDFRNNIPQMCGNCHSNRGLMKKYGLSTAVLASYLEDFHGVTLSFYKKQDGPVRHIAVCTDCHGIHDITKVKGPGATILKANLVTRCQRCHPGATENFPDSWISHYEPDFKRAPLVYVINSIYSVFIPFMIVGLVLQIILHIWRYAVNR